MNLNLKFKSSFFSKRQSIKCGKIARLKRYKVFAIVDQKFWQRKQVRYSQTNLRHPNFPADNNNLSIPGQNRSVFQLQSSLEPPISSRNHQNAPQRGRTSERENLTFTTCFIGNHFSKSHLPARLARPEVRRSLAPA